MSDAQIKALQRRIEELENSMRLIPARPRSRGSAAQPGAAILEGLSGLTPGRVYYRNGLGASWALWDGEFYGAINPALALDAERLLLSGVAELQLSAAWATPAIDQGTLLGSDITTPSLVKPLAVLQKPLSHGICLEADAVNFLYKVAWMPSPWPRYSSAEISAETLLEWKDVEACEDGEPVTIRVMGMVIS